MEKIEFGTIEETEFMDEEGSTMTTVTDIKMGKPKSPKRIKLKVRQRVYSRSEERQKYLEFSKQLEDDPALLDPGWSIEHSKDGDANGYYYAVKTYTLLKI